MFFSSSGMASCCGHRLTQVPQAVHVSARTSAGIQFHAPRAWALWPNMLYSFQALKLRGLYTPEGQGMQ